MGQVAGDCARFQGGEGRRKGARGSARGAGGQKIKVARVAGNSVLGAVAMVNLILVGVDGIP